MTLMELVKRCSRGYEKDFPESPLTEHVDAAGKPLDPMPLGDTLAAFVVRELHDTYDKEATDDVQKREAIRVMKNAARDLENIIRELGCDDAQEREGAEMKPAYIRVWRGGELRMCLPIAVYPIVDILVDETKQILRINLPQMRLQLVEPDGDIHDEAPFEMQDLFDLVRKGVPAKRFEQGESQ